MIFGSFLRVVLLLFGVFLSVFSSVIALFYFMIRYNKYFFLIYVCVYEQINVFCLIPGCKQILRQ